MLDLEQKPSVDETMFEISNSCLFCLLNFACVSFHRTRRLRFPIGIPCIPFLSANHAHHVSKISRRCVRTVPVLS
jgi:hypothetical protein